MLILMKFTAKNIFQVDPSRYVLARTKEALTELALNDY
jgi:hypothetical protein